MRSGRAGLVVAVAGIVVASASVAAVAPDASWTSFGHDQAVGAFTPAPASTTKVKSFALAWQATLDGGITASPLAAPVPGRGLVVFAATSKGNAPDRRGVAAEGRLLAYDVASPASAPAAFDPVPGQDNLGGI